MTSFAKELQSKKPTLQRAAIIDITRRLETILNPPFEEKDKIRKLEILGISTLRECFVTNKPLTKSGRGDHLYEMRGYYSKTGEYGLESKWNMLPVLSTLNTQYKKFKTVDKDIGWQTLTQEELDQCTEHERDIYDKVSKWKAYVASRGAVLSCSLSHELTTEMNTDIQYSINLMTQTMNRIVAILTKSNTEASPTQPIQEDVKVKRISSNDTINVVSNEEQKHVCENENSSNLIDDKLDVTLEEPIPIVSHSELPISDHVENNSPQDNVNVTHDVSYPQYRTRSVTKKQQHVMFKTELPVDVDVCA